MSTSSMIMQHPGFSIRTVLATNASNEIFKAARRMILLRDTGLVFAGNSGDGKTKALARLAQLLRSDMPELVIVRHNSLNKPVDSIRGFYKHFLHSAGHPDLSGETFDLRLRLSTKLIDLVNARQGEIVVFLIDEANAMTVEDFNFLKDIYNDLEKKGVQLITIMMGQQPQLSQVLSRLSDQKRDDLLARFVRRVLPVPVFSNSEDLSRVLRQYDVNSMSKENSTSWTQSLVPHAWDAGFRLEGEAKAMLKGLGKRRKGGHSARIVFLTIRYFLLTMADRDNPGVQLPANAWSAAAIEAKVAERELLDEVKVKS